MTGNYPGIYRGICFDTADPEGRLRVRVKVPQLLGDTPTGWAWPCLPAGWRNGLVKPHDTHVGHGNHSIASHGHGTAASGTATGTDSNGDSHNLSVSTTGSTTSVTGTTILSHDHNHDAHTNNVLPSGSDPGGHVLHQKTPKIGEGVWVMFEGGDSDHPVWMGTF